MPTIAIIDDDPYIGDLLETVLRRERYAVIRAYSGTEALLLLTHADTAPPDLVLLDLMLPGLSGEDVLPHLVGIPVIVLSAKVDVQDKVELLRGGAVDYVTKPFDTQELLARIHAHLREREWRATAPDAALRCGDLSLDVASHAVTIGGEPVRLTPTEFALLEMLMRRPSQVITRTQMQDRIAEDAPDSGGTSLKMHMSNLRAKLRAVGDREYIETVWGIGFTMGEG